MSTSGPAGHFRPAAARGGKADSRAWNSRLIGLASQIFAVFSQLAATMREPSG
jgi:hypothetical protein